jgi:hypothetical protein
LLSSFLDESSETSEGPGDPGFDSSDRNAEAFRRVSVGKPLQHDEFDTFSLFVRKALDGRSNVVGEDQSIHEVLPRARRFGNGLDGHDLAASSQVIDSALTGQVDEEGCGISTRFETATMAPELEEHVLDYVIHVVARDESGDHRPHRWSVELVTLLERGLVRVVQALDETRGVLVERRQRSHALFFVAREQMVARSHSKLSSTWCNLWVSADERESGSRSASLSPRERFHNAYFTDGSGSGAQRGRSKRPRGAEHRSGEFRDGDDQRRPWYSEGSR